MKIKIIPTLFSGHHCTWGTQSFDQPTCYPASAAIDTLAFKPHLLSGQFAINPQLLSTILKS